MDMRNIGDGRMLIQNATAMFLVASIVYWGHTVGVGLAAGIVDEAFRF